MGIFSRLFGYFFERKGLDQQLEAKFKEIASLRKSLRSTNNSKLIFFVTTFLAGFCFLSITLYLSYQSKVNRLDVEFKYVLFSSIMTVLSILVNVLFTKFFQNRFRNILSKIKVCEEGLKAMVKRAMDELPYKKLDDLLKKYDPEGKLFEEENKAKSKRSQRVQKKSQKNQAQSNTQINTLSKRTITDKIVDTLIGDNPQNRAALICQFCKTHNGLLPPNSAFPFDYRCFQCQSMNCITNQGTPVKHTSEKSSLLSSNDSIEKSEIPKEGFSDLHQYNSVNENKDDANSSSDSEKESHSKVE